VDHWRSYDGHNLENTISTGAPTANNNPAFPEREDTVVSPRAGVMYHVNDRVSVWGAFGTGFRAPTLNELYRRFAVGTTTTLPNPNLGPERLTGGDMGVNVAPTRDMTVRVTWYDNHIKNPVSNATISVVGANVTVQRQNLGKTRIHGLQTDLDYQISRVVRVSGGYLHNTAIVKEAVNPRLVTDCPGRPGEPCFLPQVPANRGSFRVTYSDDKYATVAFGMQAIGLQYDDDLNSRVVPGETKPGLPSYALFDLVASRRINRNFDVYLGIENLFEQEYIVGTLPTLVGSPRFVNVGVRVRFSGR
jgi:outer membrane receptor protein involved in Fe transport